MKKIIITIASILLPLSAHAGFTLNQTGVNSDGVANSSSISCTFASNPARGDLVVVGYIWWNGSVGTEIVNSILDGSGNAYTMANATSSAFDSTAGVTYLSYLLNAPSNANNTITVTFAGANGAGNYNTIFCDDFSVTGGTAALDSVAIGSNASTASITTPSIGGSYPNELVYGVVAPGQGVASLTGSWSYGGGGKDVQYSNAAEYQLAVSASTPLGMTANGVGPYDSSAISFRVVPVSIGSSPINLFLGKIFKIMKGSVFMINH